jgi:hypothetical protein
MSRDANRQQYIEIDIAGLATLIEFEVTTLVKSSIVGGSKTSNREDVSYLDWSRPTRWSRSVKRGSPRTGSKKGCTLRNCMMPDFSW